MLAGEALRPFIAPQTPLMRCAGADASAAARHPAPGACQTQRQGLATRLQPQPALRQHQQRPLATRLHVSVVGDGLTEEQQQQRGGGGGAAAAVASASAVQLEEQQRASVVERRRGACDSVVCKPEEFELAPGELSYVERGTPTAAADVFRCAACMLPECQVRALCGCRAIRWPATALSMGEERWKMLSA